MSARWHCWTYLAEQLGQACVQMFILQFVGAEDSLDLGCGVGLTAESHHPQRGGHHHRGDHNVLNIFLLCYLVVEAVWKWNRDYLTMKSAANFAHPHQRVQFKPKGQVGAVVSQCGGVAAQLLVFCGDHKGQQTKTDNVCHPHPVSLLGRQWNPVKSPEIEFQGYTTLSDNSLNICMQVWDLHANVKKKKTLNLLQKKKPKKKNLVSNFQFYKWDVCVGWEMSLKKYLFFF